MNYYVHSVEQDIAGKWHARVCISSSEAVFLTFENYPTMEEIQDAASIYVEEASNVVAE